MPCASRAWITAQRRRSGLRSFPSRCPSTPASPGSAPRPDASASHSPAPVPSAAAPDPPSTHQTPCANGNTSVRRSQLPCRLVVTSSRSQHSLQPVAADSRFAPPYASCLVPYSTPLVPVCLISTGTNRAGHSRFESRRSRQNFGVSLSLSLSLSLVPPNGRKSPHTTALSQ